MSKTRDALQSLDSQGTVTFADMQRIVDAIDRDMESLRNELINNLDSRYILRSETISSEGGIQ